MTIQDFGSIGELIGAVATVATLAYLAIQIKDNTRITKAESRRNNYSGVSLALAPIVADEAVAKIFISGLADFKGLAPVDRVRFSMMMGRLVAGAQLAFFEKLDGVSEDHADQHVNNMIMFIATPGGTAWWEAMSQNYRPQFRDEVEDLLAKERAGEPEQLVSHA
ncbi:MAG: hypothetical protein OEV20_07840 [Actinomycetota bacterium]|nr:hypothetical protein [Actinomycetota bacterium]